jgi:hypothetical protein
VRSSLVAVDDAIVHQALASIAAELPQLVFLDTDLSVISCCAVLATMRASGAAVPVVLLLPQHSGGHTEPCSSPIHARPSLYRVSALRLSLAQHDSRLSAPLHKTRGLEQPSRCTAGTAEVAAQG